MEILCKAVGAVFVMGAAGYFAVNINQSMEMRKRELRSLYSILLQLKSEIQYMCNPLPECFLKLSRGAKETFSVWLSGIADKLEQKEAASFSVVWREGLQYLYENSSLQKEDMEPLQELADKLGTADITAQIKAIDYALLHIEENRSVLEGEMTQKKKVVVTLSLFFGFMTLILLL